MVPKLFFGNSLLPRQSFLFSDCSNYAKFFPYVKPKSASMEGPIMDPGSTYRMGSSTGHCNP